MKYALIGEKLGHSFSKQIHAFQGLNYTLQEIKKEELKSFFDDKKYNGFNITIPYKKDIFPFLDEVSEDAKNIGAVNTVLFKNNKYYGYNTDIDGFHYMLSSKGISVNDKVVMVLGSGGASSMVQYYLKKNGAKKVYIISRSGEYNYQNYSTLLDTQILINTTPVGMYPNNDECLVDLALLPSLIAVFDIIYNPIMTKLLLSAKGLGLIYSNGLPMLVKQAMIAEEIWKNIKINDRQTAVIINNIIKQNTNIVLCGMPGSGKSKIGRILSKITKKTFVDIDEEITKDYGLPATIITEQGEKAFRDIEEEVISRVSKNTSQIISLGGGSILRSNNISHLKQNGYIIYVYRDLDKLSTKGRPLSQNNSVEKLYNERKKIYESICNVKIDNNNDVKITIKEIIDSYEANFNKWC